MGTGLGPESYAIIEQGRIGQILSSKPTDRRAIIEEAAGITKYKARKRLAEARLEDAKLNLARINDIFDEVTRQMNSLKRQASKAERYAKLRDEMRVKLRVVLASKFAQLDVEAATLEQQLTEIADRDSRAERGRAADGRRARRAHAARLCHRARVAGESREAELVWHSIWIARRLAAAPMKSVARNSMPVPPGRRRRSPTPKSILGACSKSWKPIARRWSRQMAMLRTRSRSCNSDSRKPPRLPHC